MTWQPRRDMRPPCSARGSSPLVPGRPWVNASCRGPRAPRGPAELRVTTDCTLRSSTRRPHPTVSALRCLPLGPATCRSTSLPEVTPIPGPFRVPRSALTRSPHPLRRRVELSNTMCRRPWRGASPCPRRTTSGLGRAWCGGPGRIRGRDEERLGRHLVIAWRQPLSLTRGHRLSKRPSFARRVGTVVSSGACGPVLRPSCFQPAGRKRQLMLALHDPATPAAFQTRAFSMPPTSGNWMTRDSVPPESVRALNPLCSNIRVAE